MRSPHPSQRATKGEFAPGMYPLACVAASLLELQANSRASVYPSNAWRAK